MHRFLLHNSEIHETSEKVLAPGQVGLLSGWGVFSTIKVVDGVLFAWERHWTRMSRDARLLRVPMPCDPELVRRDLLRLVEVNQAVNSTLRLAVVRNGGGMWEGPATGRASDVVALTADLKQWGAGVKLDWVPQARHAGSMFRGTKVLSWCNNLAVLEEAQSRGYDEVVLLNERGEVAECTSANIFVANGSEVWTPPLESGCLPGVTRDLLLEEVHAGGYTVHERTLFPQDLETADEVFITSTTRDLLPVTRLGTWERDNHGGACQALSQSFGRLVDRYVESHRILLTER